MSVHSFTPSIRAKIGEEDTDRVQRVRVTGALDGVDADCDLHWQRYGPVEAPCIVVLGGISAHRAVREWWPEQVGPGRAIDTRFCQVLSIDWIDRLPPGWRGVTPHDQAAALVALLDALGIERLAAVVGASYGGAVALALAERWPQRVGVTLVLSMADRPAPMASALRALQRDLLRLGNDLGFVAEAVVLARALAVTCYRTEAEFAHRFAGEATHTGGCWRLPVESYLRAQGERFARQCDAERYRLLSESLDLHRIDAKALATPLHLFAVREDRLVPASDIETLALACGATFSSISSLYGHDAFLKETDAVGAWLHRHLPSSLRPAFPISA